MPVPFYLSAEPDPVFVLYHPPSTGHPLDTAVLLCPPFGWEDMCSYRSRREWAQRLADDGHPTLRIDLPGSGDSGGSPRDPDRLGAWCAAVASAVQWLRSLAGIRRVAAIGIGLGGLVALEAARSGAGIDEFVLWAVPARGRRLVRELRAFSQMESSQLDGGVEGFLDRFPGHVSVPPGEEDGGLAVAGYLLSAETVAALEEVDLSDDRLGSSLTRVLLLERDGRDADPRLRTSLEASGAGVSLAPGEGYARMMMAEPQDAVPARAVFDDVSKWLARGAALAASGGERVAVTPPAVKLENIELELSDGARVRETPLSFEHPFGDPFGVLSEPVEEGDAGLCVVWLNAGPQRRTGPNRMWVELARRWAGRGVPSLRLDLAGIGDAGGDGRPLVDPRSFFVPDYIEQVKVVLRTLQERGWPPRFIVGGLCSGGYWAFQMALEDERVLSALMLNPGVLVYDAGVSHAVRSARELRGKLLEPSTWRRLLRGDLTMTAHFRTARVLLAHLPQRLWRALSRLVRERLGGDGEQKDEVEEVFDRLRAKGARASMIFAGEEHVHIDLQRHGHLDRLDSWPSITVEHIAVPLDLHTLRPLWLQRAVHELLDRTIQGELTRLEVNRGA